MRLEFERHGNITGNTERGERVCADNTDMDNNNIQHEQQQQPRAGLTALV